MIVVTGGAGFLGSFVVERLRARGEVVQVPRSAELDLRDPAAAAEAVRGARAVVHCAVDGGGIAYMRAHPAEVARNNLLMNTNLLHAAWQAGVERFVGVSSACVYPRDCPIPMREEDIWQGYPEPSNAAYGETKRAMMEMGRAYFQQYGFDCRFGVPTNLYGPRDHFADERAHVVAALIDRFLDAAREGAPFVEVWGSGRATRELLYVEDAADAVLALLDRGQGPEPINLGNGREIAIAELARAIADACGYGGEIRFDPSKPDGQPRKCLEVSRARERLGWTARVELEEGLRRTVQWRRSSR